MILFYGFGINIIYENKKMIFLTKKIKINIKYEKIKTIRI